MSKSTSSNESLKKLINENFFIIFDEMNHLEYIFIGFTFSQRHLKLFKILFKIFYYLYFLVFPKGNLGT